MRARRLTSSATSISRMQGPARPEAGTPTVAIGCPPRPPRARGAPPRRAAPDGCNRARAELSSELLEHISWRARSGPARPRPRRAPSERAPDSPLAPVMSTLEPQICTNCEPTPCGSSACQGPAGVGGATAVAVALAGLLRARRLGRGVSDTLMSRGSRRSPAWPARASARSEHPPDLLPAGRRDVQRGPVRAARARRDGTGLLRGAAAATRGGRHRPIPARGARRARPAPAAARGHSRAAACGARRAGSPALHARLAARMGRRGDRAQRPPARGALARAAGAPAS